MRLTDDQVEAIRRLAIEVAFKEGVLL